MPTVVFNKNIGITRELLLEKFLKENIDARVFFWPLSSLDFFDSVGVNKNANDICQRAINLPSYYDMSKNDQKRVVDVIKKIISEVSANEDYING